ncbi:conserved hypothetical protein [Culex quinquefasciatus]|uniref:Uncharacterized protein n=1 Tax=Culex quinquefasciatus TaxID=7176 RepID=B0WYX9_CULQU|nr:conserved hypothetical protein [Culex quinquefasciatus]|eukprot:XP_001862601.1 conserved hypothetical protein [Culex quinquefasciatus]
MGKLVKNQVDFEKLDRELANKSIEIKSDEKEDSTLKICTELAKAFGLSTFSMDSSVPYPPRPQHLERLDVVPIAERFLLLQRMRRIVNPSCSDIRPPERVRKDSMPPSSRSAPIRASKQLAKAWRSSSSWHRSDLCAYSINSSRCEYGEMFIQDDRCAVRCKATWEKIAGSAKKSRRSLCVMLLSVSYSLPNRNQDAAVGQAVLDVVRICAEIFLLTTQGDNFHIGEKT